MAQFPNSPLAEIEGLSIAFPDATGAMTEVVHDVSLRVGRGEVLGIVGESGSGKSVTARTLVGLTGARARISARALRVNGRDLGKLSERQWWGLRGREVGLVLQDALVSLDPMRTVGSEIVEAIRAHAKIGKREAWLRAVALLGEVGIPDPELRARQYSHELSGGLRQRALIATAVAADAQLIIADEPTTALDVAVQLQVLALLRQRVERGAGVILVSHDIGLIERIADHVLVMQRGMVVESGPARAVLGRPTQAYTRRLLRAIPSGDSRGYRLSPQDEENAAGAAAGRVERLPQRPARSEEEVLAVTAVSKAYRNARGSVLRQAVRDVSFSVRRGETVGLVGESGSGKSTVAKMILGLAEPDSGEILLEGQPWSGLPEAQRRARRARIQIVTQDTLGVFDPRYSVRRTLLEALEETRHPDGAAAAAAEVDRLLDQVRLAARHLDKPLRALSGGERQRVAIARALATQPRLLVCDEPVSALDVSIQAQVLDLLWELQADTGLSYLFISHDLGVVHHISDRVLVMRDGRIVEAGDADDIFERPRHPYTSMLVAAVPKSPRHAGNEAHPRVAIAASAVQ